MKTITTIKFSQGKIDVHIDGDIYIEQPNGHMKRAGRIADEDFDPSLQNICGSMSSNSTKKFIKMLKDFVKR